MLALLYIRLRWIRLTTRRYGFRALFTSYRPQHGGIGHGVWNNPLGRAHAFLDGTPAMYIVRQLQLERSLLIAETAVLV